MAADKYVVGLSRLQMYESKCMLSLPGNCLFLFLNINTARMPTISRQFIPLIYGNLGKKEYFLKAHLLYLFTSVKSCPLVIFEKYIGNYIFMTIP